MLNTGQRYITVCNLQLNDIERVESKENNKYVVTIIARITKGNQNYNQSFNIEGDLFEPVIMNFVYMLNEHLMINHNLKLSDWKTWKETSEIKDTFIWGKKVSNFKERISYSTVYKTFRKFYENAGILAKTLVTHSFRSGFYCQSFLNSMKSGFPIEIMNELTMLLAGWKQEKEQTIYRKDEMSALVALKGTSVTPSPEQMLGYEGTFIN